MNVDITVLVGIGSALFGIAIGFLGYKRNENKDIKDETQKDTTTIVKLDYISKGVDDIRIDIKAQDRKIQDILIDITKLKESTKSAHYRLDTLEENIKFKKKEGN